MIRARLETALNRRWYRQARPPWWLRALERVYRRASARRLARELALQPPDLAGRPVVVVGNITAGGSGKTPLLIRLCELLAAEGLRPGVVSRGYGRRVDSLMIVDGTQPVQASGDEPRLIFERCGVPVAVSSNRVQAARELFSLGVDVVLSDDGLQHRRLPRVYEICVIDGQRGLGNGHLLPAGPLREDVTRLDSVDAVVINEGSGSAADLPEGVAMSLAPGLPTHVSDGARLAVATWLEQAAGKPVVAVAGIGNPGRFFRTLQSLGIAHRRRAFPDHHAYTLRDFEDCGDARIIMTEKDAVKCRELGLQDAWYLPVSAVLPAAWERAFCDRILHCLPAGQGAP